MALLLRAVTLKRAACNLSRAVFLCKAGFYGDRRPVNWLFLSDGLEYGKQQGGA